jgi:hypothetical protein
MVNNVCCLSNYVCDVVLNIAVLVRFVWYVVLNIVCTWFYVCLMLKRDGSLTIWERGDHIPYSAHNQTHLYLSSQRKLPNEVLLVSQLEPK